MVHTHTLYTLPIPSDFTLEQYFLPLIVVPSRYNDIINIYFIHLGFNKPVDSVSTSVRLDTFMKSGKSKLDNKLQTYLLLNSLDRQWIQSLHLAYRWPKRKEILEFCFAYIFFLPLLPVILQLSLIASSYYSLSPSNFVLLFGWTIYTDFTTKNIGSTAQPGSIDCM